MKNAARPSVRTAVVRRPRSTVLLALPLSAAGRRLRRRRTAAMPPAAAAQSPRRQPPVEPAAPPRRPRRRRPNWAARRSATSSSSARTACVPTRSWACGPRCTRTILKRAAYSLKARTIRRASTLPSHAAMLSGFDVKEHGLFWNSWKPERGYIQVPTVFDAAEKSGGSAAAFVGKQKLAHIAHPRLGRHVLAARLLLQEGRRGGGAATSSRRSPQIEFIHFSDPDDLGHSDGWMSNPQLEAVAPDRQVPRHADGRRRTPPASIARRCSSSRPITAATAATTPARSRRTASSPGSPGAPASAPATHQEPDQHRRHGGDRALGPRLPHPPGRRGKARPRSLRADE